MMIPTIIILLFFSQVSFGQTATADVSINNKLAASKRIIERTKDSLSNPIKYARTLEEFLAATFPENSQTDGRWVYYKNKADLKKLYFPAIAKVLPNHTFYSINLTNYLGWHITQGTCVVLFDSTSRKMIYTEPLWYNDSGERLIKLFICQKFENKNELVTFLSELHELMQTGSGYKFVPTQYSDNSINYDLLYYKGDSYSTGGNITTSSVNYKQDGVWRKIQVDIKDLTIIRYSSMNPLGKGDKKVIE